MRPKILLVFLMRFEEAARTLQGIVQFERTHRQWSTFLDDEARTARDAGFLRGERWNGVISRHTSPMMVETCRELGIPLVDLNDVPPFPGVPKIRPDNVAIGHRGAEHLLERGFRHFAFCGFAQEGWSCERREGFVEALKLNGHSCAVLDVNYPGVITPEWNAAQTRELIGWLKQLPKPCGIMACVDVRAFQVLSATQNAGLLVPEEIALVGVNNDTMRCELSYPPLSSVAPNSSHAGYHAAELLDRMLRGDDLGTIDTRIEPLGVVTRLSTDVLAVADKHVAAALSFIRERSCRGITVQDVVTHAAASRSQIEKKFRQFIGRSPQAEIRRVQLTRVKELLLETDLPLKTIASMTGFEHDEYMSVVFKRMTSFSPGQFRKRAKLTRV
ncbi:XylR family transcriptional regulator [Opitutus terrae]|uniref:Transcriptional regulator, AraC family n=1 Tax=Opitutus terrae (strain DSM 11246 / JCM 15787 / PB90-1) TaxID=452637 RepID=B1ZN78_OPITP|nr:DNA-binding transcriptional regulator [Opitutus terrae]ACB73447.1 transcriptional regulator, AraC family [Opitutus terrae PB90-1]